MIRIRERRRGTKGLNLRMRWSFGVYARTATCNLYTNKYAYRELGRVNEFGQNSHMLGRAFARLEST